MSGIFGELNGVRQEILNVRLVHIGLFGKMRVLELREISLASQYMNSCISHMIKNVSAPTIAAILSILIPNSAIVCNAEV